MENKEFDFPAGEENIARASYFPDELSTHQLKKSVGNANSFLDINLPYSLIAITVKSNNLAGPYYITLSLLLDSALYKYSLKWSNT